MCTAVARPPEEREGVRHRESHVQTPDRVARAPIEVPSEARRGAGRFYPQDLSPRLRRELADTAETA
jgi:hypothetical protein